MGLYKNFFISTHIKSLRDLVKTYIILPKCYPYGIKQTQFYRNIIPTGFLTLYETKKSIQQLIRINLYMCFLDVFIQHIF